MALVVEDGTGKSTADAYADEAYVTSYESGHMSATTFADAAAAVQERAIRVATQYLDSVYGLRWLGIRANSAQALDWPRSYVYDASGYSVDSDSLPAVLKQACAELAIAIAGGDDPLAAETAADRNIKSETVRVGPVVEGKEYFPGGKAQAKRYPRVEALLRAITDPPGTMVRG